MSAEHNRLAPIDLHTHTTHSDGMNTPTELLQMAAQKGLAAIAFADHDTVAAYDETGLFSAASLLGVELIPAVEISTVDSDGRRLHVLGQFIDYQRPQLSDWLGQLQASRRQYSTEVVQLLQTAGWRVELNSVDGQTITKAHIADAVIGAEQNSNKLVDAFGRTPTRGAFIEKLMNEGGSCYVKREIATPQQAIQVIHEAGGLAFFAHPVAAVYEQGMMYQEIAEKAVAYGFDGIEAIYYYFHKSHNDQEVDEIARFIDMASYLNLLVCGGSDFHGDSTLIGRFMDMGYSSKEVYPDLGLLRSLRAALEKKKPGALS